MDEDDYIRRYASFWRRVIIPVAVINHDLHSQLCWPQDSDIRAFDPDRTSSPEAPGRATCPGTLAYRRCKDSRRWPGITSWFWKGPSRCPSGCAASRRLSNRACRDCTERTSRCVRRSGRRHR